MRPVHVTKRSKHTQPFYGSLDFVRDNPGELVPEETFTHSHLSWSSIIPYLLHLSFNDPWHPVCSIYMPDSLFPQSSSFLWSTSWHGTLLSSYMYSGKLSIPPTMCDQNIFWHGWWSSSSSFKFQVLSTSAERLLSCEGSKFG